MRYVGRLRWTDIADLLCCDESTVRYHHDRSLEALSRFWPIGRGTTEAADLYEHTDDPTFDAAEAELDAWIQARASADD